LEARVGENLLSLTFNGQEEQREENVASFNEFIAGG